MVKHLSFLAVLIVVLAISSVGFTAGDVPNLVGRWTGTTI